jgi:hypothetical protein
MAITGITTRQSTEAAFWPIVTIDFGDPDHAGDDDAVAPLTGFSLQSGRPAASTRWPSRQMLGLADTNAATRLRIFRSEGTPVSTRGRGMATASPAPATAVEIPSLACSLARCDGPEGECTADLRSIETILARLRKRAAKAASVTPDADRRHAPAASNRPSFDQRNQRASAPDPDRIRNAMCTRRQKVTAWARRGRQRLAAVHAPLTSGRRSRFSRRRKRSRRWSDHPSYRT